MSEVVEGAMLDPGTGRARDAYRRIGRAIVEHDDFIREPGQRRQALRKMPFFIVHNQEDRQPWSQGIAPPSVRGDATARAGEVYRGIKASSIP